MRSKLVGPLLLCAFVLSTQVALGWFAYARCFARTLTRDLFRLHGIPFVCGFCFAVDDNYTPMGRVGVKRESCDADHIAMACFTHNDYVMISVCLVMRARKW